MCGIFGHTGFNEGALEASRGALHRLTHRGPDQWGEWRQDSVYIGHRRLSVIDLSDAGRQPMVSADGQTVLTANGEIYNFRSLRDELKAKHAFTSDSDSEVLLHGYREWGIDGLVERIEGMYAFCIYDVAARQVVLVRDRPGIKPLYYARVGGVFAWASELKALEQYFGAALEVDHTALYDFLTYLYVPAPKSLYKSVFKLEPAHYVTFDVATGAVKKRRYWALECAQDPMNLDAAAETLRTTLRETVRDQLVSDVPVGFFLSGGMDSSAVVAEACQITDHVHTYSIGFDVTEHNETHYAQIVARHFNTQHEERILSESTATDLLGQMKTWFDEPFGDNSSFPTYLVSKFCRETSTVALTGDGGDEVFGGYDWYCTYPARHAKRIPALAPLQPFAAAARNRFRNVLGRAASRLEWRMLDELALHTKNMNGMIREDKLAYAAEWEIPEDYDDYWYYRQYWRTELPMKQRLQYMDFHTILPDRFLTKVDRVSMAVSLETRVPLLGTKLIEFCFTLPEPVLYYGDTLKGLFKYAYHDALPAEILNRGKKGFSSPVKMWRGLFQLDQYSLQEEILQKLFPQHGLSARANAAAGAAP